jgi:histone H3/H4
MSDDDAATTAPHEVVLPLVTIEALMRKWLPPDAAVSSASKELMRTCVVELIAFVTSEACDLARDEERATLTGDDIVRAARKLGFRDYDAPLTQFLAAYRAAMQRPSPSAAAHGGSVFDNDDDDDDDDDERDDDKPTLIVPSTAAADFDDIPLPDLGGE